MKIIALYSDVDDFIVACFVATVFVVFLLNRTVNVLKSRKKRSTNLFQNDEIDYDVQDYALNFQHNVDNYKSIGFKSKFILAVFSLVIIITPLHEFIGTLRPQVFFEGWACFRF